MVWSGNRNLVEARFSAPVQTGPGAHPASCTMGTGSFPGVKSGRGVTLTPHPLLVPWSWKSRAIPLLPLWAVRPVQSLSACTGMHFTLPKSYVGRSGLHQVVWPINVIGYIKKYLKCDPFPATTWEHDKVQNVAALFLLKTPYLGPCTKFPA